MKTTLLLILGALSSASLVHSTILINEVHVNPKGSDGNFEYIELKSVNTANNAIIPNASTDGLYLILIQTEALAPKNPGVVIQAWNLNTFTTGSQGLMLLGDDYDQPPFGGPWASGVPATTKCWDPPGMGGSEIDGNDGMSLFLVSGYNPAAVIVGTTDLDTNNDGVFDVVLPWTTTVDSVGFRDRDNNPKKTYALADVGLAQTTLFDPDNVSRKNTSTGATPNEVADWYGGRLAGEDSLSTAYITTGTNNFFGYAVGGATPGRANLAVSLSNGDFRINEVGLDPSGSDLNYEYIEIKNVNTANLSASCEGHYLLLIDSYIGATSTDVGRVVKAWNLSGMATGSNGLLLIGDNYPNAHPWKGYIAPETQLGDPSDTDVAGGNNHSSKLDFGDIGEDDGFTLALVKGWGLVNGTITDSATEIVGYDFDASDVGPPGASSLSTIGTVVDSIGFDQPAGAKTYATGKIISATPPDNMSRVLGSTVANDGTATHWYGGSYLGENGVSLGIDSTKAFGNFVGMGTPGRENLNAAPPAPAPGTILINEVQVDPSPNEDNGATDGNNEYIEIYSTTGGIVSLNGVTLVGVNTTTATPSYKSLLVNLSGYTTGPNGLLILGDSYNDSIPYSSQTGGSAAVDTVREDPQGLNAGEIAPNNGITVCLVGGSSMVKPNEASPPVVINPAAPPWTTLYDSVGFGTVPAQFGATTVANVSQVGWIPDNVSRVVGDNRANTAAAWYGAALDQAGGLATQIYYGSQYFGTFKGGASPGRRNHSATPSPSGLLFNEVHLDPPDGKAKTFIEIISPTKGAQSCTGYSIVVVDGGGADIGSIRHIFSLDGLSTGSNGLLLLGPDYGTANPWAALTDPLTKVAQPLAAAGTPDEWTSVSLINQINGGGVTLVLVRDLQRYLYGHVPQDLDALGGTLDAGDGVFDPLPAAWESVTDSVTVKTFGLTGTAYVEVAPLTVPKNVTQGTFTPDSMSRRRGNLAANSSGIWFGGDIVNELFGVDSTVIEPVERFGTVIGRSTPGGHNGGLDTLDEDGDGFNNLMEDALGFNPNANDSPRAPQFIVQNVLGQNYNALSFTQWDDGTGTQGTNYSSRGYLYQIQTSPNLSAWTTNGTIVGVPVSNPDGTQTVVIRSPTPIVTGSREFLRLKVTRQ